MTIARWTARRPACAQRRGSGPVLRRALWLVAVATALLGSAPAGAQGSYTTFGRADACHCPASNTEAVPFLVGEPPRVGQAFIVLLYQPCTAPAGSVVLLTGASRAQWGSIALPFDPGGIPCGAGCTWCGKLLVSIDAVSVASCPCTDDVLIPCAGPTATRWCNDGYVAFAIPNDPRLVGASFYQQILVTDRAGNRMLLSAGGHGVIGA